MKSKNKQSQYASSRLNKLINREGPVRSLFDEKVHPDGLGSFWTYIYQNNHQFEGQMDAVGFLRKVTPEQGAEKKFALLGTQLIAYEPDNKTPKKFKDLTNTLLEKVISKRDDKRIHMLCFTKNRIHKVYEVDAEDVADFWINLLKKECVLRGFCQYYILKQQISVGKISRVYSAVKKQNNSDRVAVKVYYKINLAGDDDKESIKKEVSIQRIMEHQNLPKFESLFENERFLYIVTEYLPIEFHKRPLPFSEADAAEVIFNLLNALKYMHSMQVIHRDVKPQNIMIRNGEQPNDICLIDFSISEFYREDGDYLYKRCGTPGYVAPEILENKLYDYKVDLFSSGVVLFTMLSGQHPFPSLDPDELKLLNEKCEIDFSWIKDANPLAVDFVKKLLSKDPQHRPNASEALQHPWLTSQTHLEPKANKYEYLPLELPPKCELHNREILKTLCIPQFEPINLEVTIAHNSRQGMELEQK